LLVALIVTVPLVVIYVVFLLPPFWGPLLFTITMLIVWAFASGYKDWVVARRKEEEEKRKRQIS
jgi:hypothetical protein